MFEARSLSATRPRRARICPYVQVHACPRQIVVGVVLLALVLTGLEVAVLHLGAHVPRVVVELGESAGHIVHVARAVQAPLHDGTNQCTHLDGERSQRKHLYILPSAVLAGKWWPSCNTLTTWSAHLGWELGKGLSQLRRRSTGL